MENSTVYHFTDTYPFPNLSSREREIVQQSVAAAVAVTLNKLGEKSITLTDDDMAMLSQNAIHIDQTKLGVSVQISPRI